MSHPTWVRGLKHSLHCLLLYAVGVAPYVGAWIETFCRMAPYLHCRVAPYVGAWIETHRLRDCPESAKVAPYVGAWIETL